VGWAALGPDGWATIPRSCIRGVAAWYPPFSALQADDLFLESQFLLLQLREDGSVGQGAVGFRCDSLIKHGVLGFQGCLMRRLHDGVPPAFGLGDGVNHHVIEMSLSEMDQIDWPTDLMRRPVCSTHATHDAAL